MKLTRSWGAVVALLLIAGWAYGQEFRGRVQGVATDPSGAAIPGAAVALKNDATGVEVKRVSNPEGRYLFDYVDPGAYTLTVEMSGFKTTVQKNIVVQQRGDVTVDVKLEVGEVTEVLTVSESPVGVQFNTASRDLTVEQKMVRELPSITRNPLQLVLLDPTVINRGSKIETQPYHHRTSNEMDLGGATKYRNDVVLDGTPLTAGNKLGYTPPMDAVTEYTVQQNSVDAEFGHSAGGIAVVTMKSGTNEVHGSAYYYGRSPGLNALTTRLGTAKHSENPYWNAGATIGAPIKKNKAFLFAVFEKIENTSANPATYTLPTALERQGDFSQSLTKDGKQRVIYDPLTHQPFPGNVIPQERWDPVASKILSNLWQPATAGDDATGLNNFRYLSEQKFHYYNFSTRVDVNISDRWKAFGRISRMKTDQDEVDFTGGNDPLKMRNVTGSKRNGWNIAADTVYMFNPTTTLNVRGSFYQAEDKRDYPEMAITEQDYVNLWGANQFWDENPNADYMSGRPLLYFPHMVIDSNAYGRFGVQNFWYQEPAGYSAHARLSKYFTKHTVKAGTEIRLKRGQAARFYFMDYGFSSKETGKDYKKADATTGHPWASFLLGAINPNASNSRTMYRVMQKANTEMYAFYVQDDFRISPKLTVNVGLRYEYEGGFWDPLNRLPQQLDLTQPIPGMASDLGDTISNSVDPKTGNRVGDLMAESAGQKSQIYNGAYYFTEDGNNRKNAVDKWQFAPRIGIAWRLDDKTAVRAGYGRFTVPASLANPERDTLGELDLGGFTPTTNVQGYKGDQLQAYLADPFPLGLNPITGKQFGAFTNLGTAVTIDEYEQRPPISDRINLSIQRELPGRFIVDATFFMNFVSRDQYNVQLNTMDPRLSYKYKKELDNTVPNPFKGYGAGTYPENALFKDSTVKMTQLLRPYPQYGNLTQTGTDLRKMRYQSFQLRVQRPFHNGISLLATYAWVKAKSEWFYDPQDEYDGKLSWFDFPVSQSGGQGNPSLGTSADPLHRFTGAATLEIPVGRGRRFGSDLPPALDAVVGGWQISGMVTYQSGGMLIFSRSAIHPASAPEQLSQVGGGKDVSWFSAEGFAKSDTYDRRTNPWSYSGLTGPNFKNLDLGISKRFKLSDRIKLELRADAFNALNMMNFADPQLDESKSDFGKTNAQVQGYYGRQIQYSARIEF